MDEQSPDRPAARTAATPPAPPAVERAGWSRRPPRTVLIVALLASVALHALALLFIGFEFEIHLAPGGRPAEAVTDGVMRALDIVAVEDGGEPEEQLERDRGVMVDEPPPTVLRPPAVAVPPVMDAAPPARAEAAPPIADRRSVTERLSPRMGDPRLWTGPTEATPPLTRLDAARAELGSRIAAYNDSLRAAEEAAGRALDWTVEDADGKRWGISPGKLHLGSITLPLPVQFSTPADRRDEVNRRLADWTAIQLQRARADAQATIKERAKEIRERKARADTSKAGGTD